MAGGSRSPCCTTACWVGEEGGRAKKCAQQVSGRVEGPPPPQGRPMAWGRGGALHPSQASFYGYWLSSTAVGRLVHALWVASCKTTLDQTILD